MAVCSLGAQGTGSVQEICVAAVLEKMKPSLLVLTLLALLSLLKQKAKVRVRSSSELSEVFVRLAFVIQFINPDSNGHRLDVRGHVRRRCDGQLRLGRHGLRIHAPRPAR